MTSNIQHPSILIHPNSTLRPCHCSLAPGTSVGHGPPSGPARLKARRVLQRGARWLAGSFSYFCGDYAPSIGHAPKPLHLMYIERREESDGEEGGGAGREGGRVEGGGASSLQSHLGFFSQVVLISGAHVCESMNLRRHKVSAQQSQLASLLFFTLPVIFA